MVRDSEECSKEGVACGTDRGVGIGCEGVGLPEEGLEEVRDGASGFEGERTFGRENLGRGVERGWPGATACRHSLMRAKSVEVASRGGSDGVSTQTEGGRETREFRWSLL